MSLIRTKKILYKNLTFLKQLNRELPYDPKMLLPGACPVEVKAGSQIYAHRCSFQHYSLLSVNGGNISCPSTWMEQPNVAYTT